MNPYGDGYSSVRMVDILTGLEIHKDKIKLKSMTFLKYEDVIFQNGRASHT